MIYIKFTYDTPYAGTTEYDYLAFPDDTTEDFLNEWAENDAQINGESYEYLIEGWDREPTEEELENYWEGVAGYWERISEKEWKEHDGSVVK